MPNSAQSPVDLTCICGHDIDAHYDDVPFDCMVCGAHICPRWSPMPPPIEREAD